MEGVFAAADARHRALLDALPDLEIGGDISKLANPPELVVGSSAHELLPHDIADS